jgi:hypothetical protein
VVDEPRASRAARTVDDGAIDWQSHPSVNSERRCPYCAEQALHEQHCKQICLSCGWYKSCVD